MISQNARQRPSPRTRLFEKDDSYLLRQQGCGKSCESLSTRSFVSNLMISCPPVVSAQAKIQSGDGRCSDSQHIPQSEDVNDGDGGGGDLHEGFASLRSKVGRWPLAANCVVVDDDAVGGCQERLLLLGAKEMM
jgi:hypothetical protein